jgi:hypothetical protein
MGKETLHRRDAGIGALYHQSSYDTGLALFMQAARALKHGHFNDLSHNWSTLPASPPDSVASFSRSISKAPMQSKSAAR